MQAVTRTIALILCVALSLGSDAMAQGNSGKNKGGGKKADKVTVGNPGKGNKTVPPGQIKRYTRGAKLPPDLSWEDIGDLKKWKLPPPGNGNRYIRVNDEILEVTKDVSTVVEAVGIVSDLLN